MIKFAFLYLFQAEKMMWYFISQLLICFKTALNTLLWAKKLIPIVEINESQHNWFSISEQPKILNIHFICRWQSYLDFILNLFELRSLKSFKGKVLYVQGKKKSSYEPRNSLWVTKQIISLIINSKSFEAFLFLIFTS